MEHGEVALGELLVTRDGAPSDPFAYDARWGYYRDPETAYYLCRSRYYDPIGRWVTRDPVGFEGGMNPYIYCAGQPVGNADPSGLTPDKLVASENSRGWSGDAAANRALMGLEAKAGGVASTENRNDALVESPNRPVSKRKSVG